MPHYSSGPAFHCQCQARMDVRCLNGTGWTCQGVTAATQYLVQPQSTAADLRLRQHVDRTTWSRNSDLNYRQHIYPDDGLTSSSSSPEPFTRHGSNSSGHQNSSGDGDFGGTGKFFGTPSQTRRVYTLARAYSDRVKQLQRSSSSCRTADCRSTGIRGVTVHRARARSASVGQRSTPLSLSPALLYK